MTQKIQGCCTTTPAAMFFWAAIFLLFYGATIAVRSMWPAADPYRDTLLLAALATACVINFGRNRTLHCGITGPLFLAQQWRQLSLRANAGPWISTSFGVS